MLLVGTELRDSASACVLIGKARSCPGTAGMPAARLSACWHAACHQLSEPTELQRTVFNQCRHVQAARTSFSLETLWLKQELSAIDLHEEVRTLFPRSIKRVLLHEQCWELAVRYMSMKHKPPTVQWYILNRQHLYEIKLAECTILILFKFLFYSLNSTVCNDCALSALSSVRIDTLGCEILLLIKQPLMQHLAMQKFANVLCMAGLDC
jgi:hypothetical protein